MSVMSSWVRWVGVLFLALGSAFPAHARQRVREITIRSHWGGLGPRADATITVTRSGDRYIRDGQEVAPALVNALVSALQSSLIPKPEAAALGITPSWLANQVGSQKPRSYGDPGDPTPGQRELFRSSFTDINLILRLLPELFENWHSDDYPGARVEVVFDDNTKIAAYSSSQFTYMLPWCVGPEKNATYNPAISRAVAALMPTKTVNKERLADADLAGELSGAVMREIENAYNLRGVEDRMGPALARLRSYYQVNSATIDPWLRPEYGPAKFDSNHAQQNLHTTLHKAPFPANVSDEVTFADTNNHIQGIDEFLNSAGKYEELVLSVPWLNRYILEHPKVRVRITYVHDASLGDDALRNFADDMKVRERSDLVDKAKAQQRQIALIQVGTLYAESYWLVFPDKHLLLWRYQGPSGLLNWSPTDFGEGDCADFGINGGGCSGREIAADGTLIPEGTPRDVACVQAWRAQHPIPTTPPDALFDVMENGRGGFIDRNGTVVIPLCFQAVGDFSEGLAPFERDGRWGFLDSSGNIVIQPVFPWAEEFHEGLAHVQINGSTLGIDGSWGFIDKSGGVVIPPSYKRMMSDSEGEESAFHEGLAMVEIWDDNIPPRKGFIDRSGKLAIPARFTYAYPFSEGLAAVTESQDGDSGWGFIDKEGNWAIPPRFDWASSFQFDMAPVNRKRDCGYIDKTGAQLLKLDSPPPPEDCASAWGDFTDGLSRWRFGSLYGFIDRSGKTVVPPRFNLTFGFSEGLAAVRIGRRWGFIDTKGKMVIPLQDFFDVKPFKNGLSRVVVEKHGIGYIDRTGKFVWGPHQQSDRNSE
jgi:WG containing repeat